MAWRACSTPGCGELHEGTGRCPDCRRQADAHRGRRQARGYDADYDRARAKAVAGATHCATCDEPFTEDNPATGGHVVPVREGGTAADGVEAECARCNYGWRKGQLAL
jgi:hypothetical protein